MSKLPATRCRDSSSTIYTMPTHAEIPETRAELHSEFEGRFSSVVTTQTSYEICFIVPHQFQLHNTNGEN